MSLTIGGQSSPKLAREFQLCARCHHRRFSHTKRNDGCRKWRGQCPCTSFVAPLKPARNVGLREAKRIIAKVNAELGS